MRSEVPHAWTRSVGGLRVLMVAMIMQTVSVHAQAPNPSLWSWEDAGLAGRIDSVEILPVKYGKDWAYALEFDDGGSYALEVAKPMLERFAYTDAPPGVPGGTRRPFVASLALYPFMLDSGNRAFLSWEQVRELRGAGWGVVNHSYWHTGNHWQPENALEESQLRRELFWSQAILSYFVFDGEKMCRRIVYPSGDFHYGPYIAEYGLIALPLASEKGNTLLGEPPPFDADSKFRLSHRNNMDAAAWDNRGGGDLDSFPEPRPAPGQLVLDFTHGIGKPGEPNLARWERRLGQIATHYGAEGDDSVWMASTAEILAYRRAAVLATVRLTSNGLAVEVPDGAPEAALTLRLKLKNPDAPLPEPPPGTRLHRAGAEAWLTTPTLGDDATPEFLRVARVHHGPFLESVHFEQPIRLAAVRILQRGDLRGFVPEISWRGPNGETGEVPVQNILRWSPLASRWGAWLLFPLVPDLPAPEVVEILIKPSPHFHGIEVWSLK